MILVLVHNEPIRQGVKMAEDILGFSKAIDTEGIDSLSNEQVDMILKMFEKAGY